MVIDNETEVISTPIECIKVHVESIYKARSMIVNNDGARNRTLSLSAAVRDHAVQPGRIISDIFLGRKVNGCTTIVVQIIQVIKGERFRSIGDNTYKISC